MMILRNKNTGKIRIMGMLGFSQYFDTKEEALKDYKRLQRNSRARLKNEILRDLTGTSARAARADMGG